MKNNYITVVLLFVAALLCFPVVEAQAEPNYDNLSLQYNNSEGVTVASAHEKLVDAVTSLGAAYSFPGRSIQQLPKNIDISLYGYHETVQWQDVKTLTLTYKGQTFTGKVLHSLHGEDRDKSQDLVAAKYFESILIQLPLAVAQQVFKSSTITITSTPAGINLQLTAEQIDRCRDLVDTVPTQTYLQTIIRSRDINRLATSSNGLPVTREITESSSDAVLTMPMVALTPRFGMRSMAFITSSGRKVHQPTEALLIAELSDQPLLEAEKEITLNYGDTHLILTSNTTKTTEVASGIKLSVRTYLIAYSRFLTISKSKKLSFTVGNTTVPVPPQKMAGIREIARRIQQ